MDIGLVRVALEVDSTLDFHPVESFISVLELLGPASVVGIFAFPSLGQLDLMESQETALKAPYPSVKSGSFTFRTFELSEIPGHKKGRGVSSCCSMVLIPVILVQEVRLGTPRLRAVAHQ